MNSLGPWENKMRKLSDDQKVTPPEFIWENIDAAINKKRKRRFLFFWLFALGLLGFATGAYLLNDSNSSDENQAVNLTNLNTNKSTTETLESKTKTNTNSASSDNATLNNNNSADINQTSNSNKNYGSGSIAKTRSSIKSTYSAYARQLVTKSINNTTNDQIINTEAVSNNEIQTIDQPNVDVIVASNYAKISLDEIYGLPLPEALLDYKVRTLDGLGNHDESCPVFKKKKSLHFFVEAEGNMGLALKSFKEVSDYKELYINRKNTEQDWYLWGAGFHAGLMFNNRWSIASGVDFTQVKEKFVTSRPGYSVIVIHKDPNGIPIDTVVQTGTLYNKIENRYSLIDIPLTIGYEHRINNWGFALEAGINFNISLKTNGKIYDANQNTIILQDHDDIYKPKLGLGIHGGITIHRYFSDRTSVYIRPYFNTYLNDWNQTDYPLKISNSLIRVNLGIRHMF